MSDRLCISSKGQIKTFISASDIMSCCTHCGTACTGGFTDEVFEEWSQGGFVTGSDYVHDNACKPYPFAPCKHLHMYYANSSLPVCPFNSYDSPSCVRKCQQAYKTSYEDDKFYGSFRLFSPTQ
jgi:cathepsin B